MKKNVNNLDDRVLAAVLVLRLEDRVDACVADVAAMLEEEPQKVENALTALEWRGLVARRDDTVELLAPASLSVTAQQGLAMLSELLDVGHSPSGSELGRRIGTSRTTGVTTLDLLEKLGYWAVHPRTNARRVFRTPPVEPSEWRELCREARNTIECPGTQATSDYSARRQAARARALRAFTEFFFTHGRAPSQLEHADAAGRTSALSSTKWLEDHGFLRRIEPTREWRVASLPESDLVESAAHEPIDRMVRRRLAELIATKETARPSWQSIDGLASRAGLTIDLARQLVSELAEQGGDVELRPGKDQYRSLAGRPSRSSSEPETDVRNEDKSSPPSVETDLEEVELLLLEALRESEEPLPLDDCGTRAGLARAVSAAAATLLADRGLVRLDGRLVELTEQAGIYSPPTVCGTPGSAGPSSASDRESSGNDC